MVVHRVLPIRSYLLQEINKNDSIRSLRYVVCRRMAKKFYFMFYIPGLGVMDEVTQHINVSALKNNV
jgi:hypothetical protein